MLRSMFAGVSGLRSHQVKMDVIGNNIANVNTYGYKASRVTFQEMYNQTLRSSSSPSAALGGTNPLQVGLGATTSSIDVVHEAGGTATTDRSLDFAIAGEGFFAVKQNDNIYYTRAGNFYLDDNGFMVTSTGMYLQGTMLGDESAFPTGFSGTMKFVTAADMAALSTLNAGDHMGRIMIPDGMFVSYSIDKNGLISGITENDDLVPVAQMAVGTFTNAPGLSRVGNNLYEKSNNSGEPILHKPGEGGSGTLVPGSLEMSNVDLSKEFTDMIITQRGFQANSRVITVSDTLLEELINLKR